MITGGAGFIGSHLVDNLVEKGCKVRVMDNLANGKLENISHHLGQEVFEFFHRDVTDPLDVERAMEGIDVVFHLACLGLRHSIAHPFDTHRVNAEGSLLVLDAAFRAKVDRFVYCSSSEVYELHNMCLCRNLIPRTPAPCMGPASLPERHTQGPITGPMACRR